MEVDLDGESDLDVTEVGHVLPAIRKAQTAGARAGAGGVAEGASQHHRSPPGGPTTASAVSQTATAAAAAAATAATAASAAAAAAAIPATVITKAAAAPAAATFLYSRGEKRTDRGGTARHSHFKACARGPSRGNTK